MDDGADDPVMHDGVPTRARRSHVRHNATVAVDAWSADDLSETYHGRRRAEPAMSPVRLWLTIAAVLVGFATLIAVPIALMATGGERDATLLPADPSTDDGSDLGMTGLPTSDQSTGSATPTASPTATPTPRVFAPVTYQAESDSNRLAGSAWVSSYPGASGGQIVRNIGDWGRGRDGTLRFNDVTVPATGTYAVTFYFVHGSGDRSRSVVISVAGGSSVTVTVTAGVECCSQATVRLVLRQGANDVTFGNPGGPAPSIDRIVVARP